MIPGADTSVEWREAEVGCRKRLRAYGMALRLDLKLMKRGLKSGPYPGAKSSSQSVPAFGVSLGPVWPALGNAL